MGGWSFSRNDNFLTHWRCLANETTFEMENTRDSQVPSQTQE